MPHPFEASISDLSGDLSPYVAAIVDSLQSSFMVMPKGNDFIEYSVFDDGYQALRKATKGFNDLNPEAILKVIPSKPLALVVLRTILGFTPPEWAYVASEETGVEIPLGYARSIDKRIRANPNGPFKVAKSAQNRIVALVESACKLITDGVPKLPPEAVHRLDKADTKGGKLSVIQAASLNIPYSMLLYERMLGRPFATHRDAVSEKVGDLMELPIEDILSNAGVPYRKTKRAEKILGFDQAPDFIIPNDHNPQVIIEAKITEDDGTARDKITRVQRLSLMSLEKANAGDSTFEVIACIDGRGFVRTSDLEKLITYTNGKVFTLNTLEYLINNTRLKDFASII